MIVEIVVLLRIEHLKQRGRRIAAEIVAHFVDFIEHEQGIPAFDLVEVLHDTARHRTDVGPAMAADFGLVAHATERHAHEFPVGGFGDALAQRSLADARRADQTENRALHFLDTGLYRQIFQDAVLDLFQTVVVFIEHLLRKLEVLAHFAALFPGHADQPLEIIADHGSLGGHRRHLLELVELVFGFGLHRFRHFGFGDFSGQLFELIGRIFGIAELLLDGLHLFVEVILALAFLHLSFHARTDALFDVLHIDLAFDETDQHFKARFRRNRFQQTLLVRESYAQMRGHRIGEPARLVDAGKRRQQLGRQLPVRFHILFEKIEQAALRHFRLTRVLYGNGFKGHRIRHQGIVIQGDVGCLDPLHAFDQNFDGSVRKLEQLDDRGDGADVIQILGLRVVDVRTALGQQHDQFIGTFHGQFKRFHRPFTADEQRNDHIGIHHHIAQGKHGQKVGICRFFIHISSNAGIPAMLPLWGFSGRLASTLKQKNGAFRLRCVFCRQDRFIRPKRLSVRCCSNKSDRARPGD